MEKLDTLKKQLLKANGIEKEDIFLEILEVYTEENKHHEAAYFLDTHMEDVDYSMEFLYECGLIYHNAEQNGKAFDLFSTVIAHKEDEKDVAIGKSHLELGRIIEEEGEDPNPALDHYEQAIACLKESLAAEPSIDAGFNLALAYEAKAGFYLDDIEQDSEFKDFGEIKIACQCLLEATKLYEKVAATHPENDGMPGVVADCYSKLYKALNLIEYWEESLPYCKKTVELNETIVAKTPEDLEYREALANSLFDLAMINGNLRYFQNAKKLYERSKEAFELLYKKKKSLEFHNRIIAITTALDRINRQR